MSADDAKPPFANGPLPAGHVIQGFTLQGVIGTGGFSLVYSAWDPKVEREVAIKEYMPTSLAVRGATQHVTVLSQSNQDIFEIGLRSFVNEARLLGRLDHENLVRVYHFWEENNTAYMVMPLYKGRTVKAVRAAMDGPPSEAWLRSVLEPVLSVLDYLHGQQIFHRDIAPDNILVRDDGRPLVLDFGAARRVISDSTQRLTTILKPHYAPVEQYGESPTLRQGPWTDLYALGATFHYLLTGEPPAPATARAMGDSGPPLASRDFPGIGQPLLRAIDAMMAPHPQNRPAGVAQVRAILDGKAEEPGGTAKPDPDSTVIRVAPSVAAAPAKPPPTPAPPRRGPGKVLLGAGAAAVLVLGLVIALAIGGGSTAPGPGPGPQAGPAPAAAIGAAPSAVDPAPAAPAPAAPPAATVATASPPPVVLPTAAAEAPARPAAAGQAATPSATPAARPLATTPTAAAPAPAVTPAPSPPAPGGGPREPQADRPAQPVDAAGARPAPRPGQPGEGRANTPPAPARLTEPKSSAGAAPALAQAAPRDPRENCSGRLFIALDRCMRSQCALPEVARHPECVRVRGICELPAQAGTESCRKLLDAWNTLGG